MTRPSKVIGTVDLTDPNGCIEIVRLPAGGWRGTLYRDGVPVGTTNDPETCPRGEECECLFRLAVKRLAPENLERYEARRFEVRIEGLPLMEFQL